MLTVVALFTLLFAAEVSIAKVTPLSFNELASFAPYTQFARAAYCPSTKQKDWNCGQACQANENFQITHVAGDGNVMQFYYVGYWPEQNSVVVAHEGTDPEQLVSVLRDLNIPPQRLDPTIFPGVPAGVLAHGGFTDEHALTAATILAQTKEVIANTNATTVTLVGHSLGGALAELDALFMAINLPSDIHVKAVTYGTPRVGNLAWAKYFDSMVPDFVRINNQADIVPIVPGRDLGFAHPHGEIHLLGPGKAVSCPGNDDAVDAQCTIKTVPFITLPDLPLHMLNHLGPYEGISIGTIFCD
ncbi:hypothetical protein EIP91_010576 [Steccherinum ochraceum]|uniref:Fungal lipase-type domain-containing protein n=1 Tax=Steccherinum ochraceum TaxID=92696 RepID=A0A4R0RIV1_9APHY|nr:hypothetical protein EIP91_010576 [Steccherinum ochraceum]